MPAVRRRPQTEEDLVSIWAYVGARDSAAADRLSDRLEARMKAAAATPLIGTPRPWLAPRLRSLVVGRYLIFYEPMPDGIDVARVLHSARDLTAVFDAG